MQARLIYRLLAGLLLAALLPLLLLQQQLTHHYTQELRKRIDQHLSTLADQKVVLLQNYLQQKQAAAQLLTQLPQTHALLQQADKLPSSTLEATRELLLSLSQQTKFQDLLLITAHGQIAYTQRLTSDTGTNLFQGPYRHSPLARSAQQVMATRAPAISDLEWHVPAQSHAAFLILPVFADNQLLGVLAVNIATNELRSLIDASEESGNRTLLAQRLNEPARILTTQTSLSPSQSAHALFSDQLPQLALHQSSALMHALANERGQGETLDHQQVPVLAAWRFIPESRWGLVVEISQATAYAPIVALQQQARLWLLAAAAMATLIALILTRDIVHPLRALTQAVTRIAAGDLQQRVKLRRRDEIGQLAAAANLMSEHLARSHQILAAAQTELENKVEQRTEALAWEKEHLDTIVNHVFTGIISFDDTGRVTSFNRAAERIFGLCAANICGQPVAKLIPAAFATGAPYADLSQKQVTSSEGEEFTAQRADGQSFPLRLALAYAQHAHQHVWIISVQDLALIRQTEERQRLYASVFQHSGEAMLIADPSTRVLAVNEAFCKMTGHTDHSMQGANTYSLISPRTSPQVLRELRSTLASAGFWQGEMWLRLSDGRDFASVVTITAVRDEQGQAAYHLVSYIDNSERKAAEERIAYLAHHDALTGLLNRLSLNSRLAQALATAQREEHNLAVMFIDMDRFKQINDQHGHAVGDELLIDVARRITGIVRQSDIVARLGGDEFVVVLTEVERPEASARVAEKLLHTLGEAYLINEHRLISTPSIGVALYPSDGTDIHELLKQADTAMYHAKNLGRNNVQFFAPQMNMLAVQRLRFERQLIEALDEQQFLLHYQPRLAGDSGHFVSVEALLRWQHPDEGLLMPDRFIQVAEESGVILELGCWVIDTACRQLRSWRDEGLQNIALTINLSARQLYSPSLPGFIQQTLERYELTGLDLELDIDEGVLMRDPETSLERLQRLSQLGIRLSIDNFGTGASSLHHLRQMPVASLNIDQSLVREIGQADSDAALCKATIALAHHLGLKVIAEGVETEIQRNFLLERRCDFLQGYLLGRPQSAAAISSTLRGLPC